MQKDFSFAQIVENTNDVVIVTDIRIDEPGPVIIYVNDAFTRLTGYTAEEAIGNNPRMLQSHHSDSVTRREIRARLTQNADIRTRILNVGKYEMNTGWIYISYRCTTIAAASPILPQSNCIGCRLGWVGDSKRQPAAMAPTITMAGRTDTYPERPRVGCQ